LIPSDNFSELEIHFTQDGLLLMNVSLAVIMFSVALGVKNEHFKYLLKNPRGVFVGLFSQFIALPALTFLLIKGLNPAPTLALGMILVASCPGGNVSNFFSALSKGNVALSVSITGISTALSAFLTPLNFAFWSSLYLNKSGIESPFELSFVDMSKTVLLILIIPLILGMLLKAKKPKLTAKIEKPLKVLGILILAGFIVGAFAANIDNFKQYVTAVLLIVFLHNLLALLTGYSLASIAKLPFDDRKSITIETGIQNSGLGLIIIFNFFNGNGGMAMIAAWWGIWHLVAGFTVSGVFSFPIQKLKSIAK
jgi:BASS family bile acid:Na+ symporter